MHGEAHALGQDAGERSASRLAARASPRAWRGARRRSSSCRLAAVGGHEGRRTRGRARAAGQNPRGVGAAGPCKGRPRRHGRPCGREAPPARRREGQAGSAASASRRLPPRRGAARCGCVLHPEEEHLLLAVGDRARRGRPSALRTYFARVYATSACGAPRASEKWTARCAASSRRLLVRALPLLEAHDHVSAGDAAGVQPEIVPARDAEREAVVLGGAPADEDRGPGQRAERPVRERLVACPRARRAARTLLACGLGPAPSRRASRSSRGSVLERRRVDLGEQAPGAPPRAAHLRRSAPRPARRCPRCAGSGGRTAPCWPAA